MLASIYVFCILEFELQLLSWVVPIIGVLVGMFQFVRSVVWIAAGGVFEFLFN